MKKIFYLTILTVLGLGLSVTSCTEDQLTSSAIMVDTTQVATLSGVVYAELNLQTAGKEIAPAGTNLLVTIPLSDLSSNANQGNWEKMITVGQNGAYSVEVPSNNKGVTVTVTPTDFTADLTLENNAQFPVQKTVYTIAQTTAKVKAGLTTYLDITYGIKSQEELKYTAMLYGEITGELDTDNGVQEALPTGTIVTFIGKVNNVIVWSKDVVANGKVYNLQVPANTAITAHWNFKADKNVQSPADPSKYIKVKYSYIGNSSIGTYNPKTDNIRDFNVGGGNPFIY